MDRKIELIRFDKQEPEFKYSSGVVSHTQFHRRYIIKVDDKEVLYFNYSMYAACCGTGQISNVEPYSFNLQVNNLSLEDLKDFFFKSIVDIAVKDTRSNIIYLDWEKGHINKLLSDKFTLLHSYKNSNSDNIVEIRTFDTELAFKESKNE